MPDAVAQKEAVSKTKGAYAGLCETCRQAPTCKLPRAASLPVQACERFQGEQTETMKTHKRKSPLGQPAPQNAEVPETAVDAARQMGLCSNCDSRATCRLPQARKAVVHCEEYR